LARKRGVELDVVTRASEMPKNEGPGTTQSGMDKVDFNPIAAAYAHGRSARQFVVDELREGCPGPGARVLEIGCGTANYSRALASSGKICFGIDPSSGMLRAATGDTVLLVLAAAEHLPFADRTFDFVFSVDVAHHLRDVAAYFSEAWRVLRPGGIICTATDSEHNIRSRRPLTEFWPDSAAVDLKRYPKISLLRREMAAAGFASTAEHQIQEERPVTDLTSYREKAYSCLRLITEDAFADGLRKLEAALKAGPVTGLAMYLCLWGRKSAHTP
jgi:ubiquinone/menaquinone biosynthesis C-methylase UbiE